MKFKLKEHEYTGLDVVKEAVGWAVGSCVGFVVFKAVYNNVGELENKKEVAKAAVGTFAISMVARDAARSSIDKRINAIAKGINDAKMESERKK